MTKMSACFCSFATFHNNYIWWKFLKHFIPRHCFLSRGLHPLLFCKHLSNNTYNLYAWSPSVQFAVNLSIKAVLGREIIDPQLAQQVARKC